MMFIGQPATVDLSNTAERGSLVRMIAVLVALTPNLDPRLASTVSILHKAVCGAVPRARMQFNSPPLFA